jgi:predicted transcriptional regulator
MNRTQLKSRRKKLGLSQFALASEAKVSRFNIAIFEAGHKPLKEDEKERIEKALTKKERKNA